VLESAVDVGTILVSSANAWMISVPLLYHTKSRYIVSANLVQKDGFHALGTP